MISPAWRSKASVQRLPHPDPPRLPGKKGEGASGGELKELDDVGDAVVPDMLAFLDRQRFAPDAISPNQRPVPRRIQGASATIPRAAAEISHRGKCDALRVPAVSSPNRDVRR